MKGDKLIPYGVIVAAKSGDSEAMSQILRHYEPYIIRPSCRCGPDICAVLPKVVPAPGFQRRIVALGTQMRYLTG